MSHVIKYSYEKNQKWKKNLEERQKKANFTYSACSSSSLPIRRDILFNVPTDPEISTSCSSCCLTKDACCCKTLFTWASSSPSSWSACINLVSNTLDLRNSQREVPELGCEHSLQLCSWVHFLQGLNFQEVARSITDQNIILPTDFLINNVHNFNGIPFWQNDQNPGLS